VLFVEAPLTPLGARRGRVFFDEARRTMRGPQQAAENVFVRRYFVPVPYHSVTRLTASRVANSVGQRLLAPVIRRDLRRLGLRRPLVVAGLPHAIDALPLLPRSMLVYHCSDDFSHMRGFPSTLGSLEAELCRTADIVITTSEPLCQERVRWNPRTYCVA